MKEIIKLIKEVEVRVIPGFGVGNSKWIELMHQAACYNAQTEHVMEKIASVGKVIPISPFYVCDTSDRGFVSQSVWAKHLSPSMLPKTDEIWLAPYKGRTATISVSWHIAESVCSGMLNPIGSTPELYLVTRFPTQAQLRIMQTMQAHQ